MGGKGSGRNAGADNTCAQALHRVLVDNPDRWMTQGDLFCVVDGWDYSMLWYALNSLSHDRIILRKTRGRKCDAKYRIAPIAWRP